MRSTARFGRIGAIGVALLLGCASCRAYGANSASVPGERRQHLPAWRRGCREYAKAPVSISYQDAPGGAAVFYRTAGDAAALRARTEEVARFHNGGKAKIPALHELYHLPHRAFVEPLKDGAKLLLVPKRPDPSDLEVLRRNVQQEVFNMQRSDCGHGQEAL